MIKVLIAENHPLIADLVKDFLVQHDYVVCGIASTTAEAVALAMWHKPNVVILDQRLAGYGLGTDIAATLGALPDMGILYATGNVANVMKTATHGHACIAKPYRLDDLVRSIELVREMVTTGTTSPPFPRGFWLLPPAVSAAKA